MRHLKYLRGCFSLVQERNVFVLYLDLILGHPLWKRPDPFRRPRKIRANMGRTKSGHVGMGCFLDVVRWVLDTPRAEATPH